MTSPFKPKFVVLAILDGWGIAPDGPGNAITQSNTPNMNKFWLSYPHAELETSGESVGLPRGEDGNTETGHLNLGAGKIVYQDLERINMAIAEGSFFQNEVLISAIEHAKKNNSNLHLMGLVGAGGVHSNIDHLFALIQLAKRSNFKNVFIHVFTDGRDSPPTAAKTYIDLLEKVVRKEEVGTIASIMGRYWAMDRDQRWERTAKAYFALTRGIGNLVEKPSDAIDKSYSEGRTDEFIEPSLIMGRDGKPIATISDNDAIIFFNFRIDRPRQLTKAFVFNDFSKANITFVFDPFKVKYESTHLNSHETKAVEPFERGKRLNNLFFVTMTEYGKPISQEGANPSFPPEMVEMPLSGVISESGLTQLKLTESEKERFVTFYFNGLREKAYPLEDRIIIQSPKVPTYDQKPEMAALEITETLLKKLAASSYSFVLVNYPNPDMVGHTGNIGATVKAVEVVDECIGRVANFVLAYEGMLLITADHGNAEELINALTGEIDTEHSTNHVPFIAISRTLLGKSQKLKNGMLADVAPTIIELLELQLPTTMTGHNLLAEIPEY
ncbi:phosphoglycerate mutase (2,3-diphosphoglycerate-independent) [Candidatus Woesebacteria bacterium RIFCSPHIGHO2_01_FULL_39_32]|uniref:2,3-bisphosphoglycerate-independent phosphoglycerate mutase n=2 Tax=Candidatus Woeseibacteriota TaxID=1752722 RepID=A0A0G0S723_9BACT|nr:MAG: 2,3-bisphosphoglycerate-independent phosphoglycerate mutase [Candidatus Woesebacteria bacterium GW2011_GWA1_39_8]OGM25570.1 MAG: phosphoglycerate mutase (2,3-diphosphoglycerate-independent) [Candidatus Woesebacteria bacterium RIFCSPHIGHO2_01_FULL_39_32]OGM36849.1 MAG: phosphoglycerate mutase (2,3-diphosphoglycerate-independent) [Candidatus Woesebacteria bacterium RIFCSPHIGHO2_12_FULL_38_11]OGM65101.1 MAG: phosphoglycerate mutase (2,3-diphosphoglycerate-independent) [Candidatus Woesebacte